MPASITVGVPIYRGKDFLRESLASVQSQTCAEFEVIMSLDGPDPECEDICTRFLSDSRFRLVVQPKRLGWMQHTNWLMSHAQTEFWHLQEQDDVLDSAFLETLLAHALRHPNAAAVFSDVRTFEAADVQITMSSIIGSPVIRQMKLIHEHFQGVAPLGLIRTEALCLAGGLKGNEFENVAADTNFMGGLARWGELHRVPLELYRKRVHADSTHATWWNWPAETRLQAWAAHCHDMLEQALLVEATPQERRLLWLAVIERLVSFQMPGHFLPVTQLTAEEKVSMLESFLKRCRTCLSDIPGLLRATWDEIENWTKAFLQIS